MKKALISFAATAVFASQAYGNTSQFLDSSITENLQPTEKCELVHPPLKVDNTTCQIDTNPQSLAIDQSYRAELTDGGTIAIIPTKAAPPHPAQPKDLSAINYSQDYYHDHDQYSVPKVIADTTSLTLKLDRYANNRQYREFVNEHATTTKKSGETSSLGQYKHYIAYWHAHIDRNFTLNMATGTPNLTAENPQSPYFNENMKHIIDCRNDFFTQENATSVEPYNVYLEVHGCAKQRIEAAFEPFKDQAVYKAGNKAGYTNVEIDPASLAIKLAKVDNDDAYEKSVDTARDLLKTEMAVGSLSTENAVRLFDAVLDADFGPTKLPKQDPESFSLNDHYAPHMNRQMSVLATCQETLLPTPLAAEDRKAVFTDIMACWQTQAAANYDQAIAALEADPYTILSDAESNDRKGQRMDSSDEVYTPYKQAYSQVAAEMRDNGTINLGKTEYKRTAAFVMAHTDPSMTSDILYNYGNLDKNDVNEGVLNQNYMHVLDCRDEIVGDTKPADADLKAKFQEVNQCAIAAYKEVRDFATLREELRDSNTDGETYSEDMSLEQYKLLSQATYDSNITLEQLTEAGMAADGGEYQDYRDHNVSAVLECRDQTLPAKTVASDTQKAKIDQCLTDKFTVYAKNANKVEAGIYLTIASISFSVAFGGAVVGGIRRRIRNAQDNRARKKQRARTLSSN